MDASVSSGVGDLRVRALRTLAGHNSTRTIKDRIAVSDYDVVLGDDVLRLVYELSGRDAHEFDCAVSGFVEFCDEFLLGQLELARTGAYSCKSFSDAEASVYSDAVVMKRYLNSLLLSYAFWLNHNILLGFFRDDFVGSLPVNGRVVEVPTGNGLFLSVFSGKRPGWNCEGYDLSEHAVGFARRVLRANGGRARFEVRDVFDIPDTACYDAIVCGELLEHLEDPYALLDKLSRILAPGGRLFLTTAIFAYSPDHIWLFRNAREVREMLGKRFSIENELVLPVFPSKTSNDTDTPMNYAAVLSHRA
jgi:2-polyprenyl-3-methyl-5-hydroxy-6-metoxy-1,4-benzoquinol methylase